MTTVPYSATAFLSLPAQTSVGLASVSYRAAWTVVGWFHTPADFSADQTLITLDGTLLLGIQQGVACSGLDGAQIVATVALKPNRLVQIALVYDGQGTFSICYDGLQVYHRALSPALSGALALGGGAAIQLLKLCVYGLALTGEQLADSRFSAGLPADPSPDLAWDWTRVPPLAAVNGAVQSASLDHQEAWAPALSSGAVNVDLSDPIDLSSDFTFQTWLCLPATPPSHNTTANLVTLAGLSLYLQWVGGSGWTVGAWYGSEGNGLKLSAQAGWQRVTLVNSSGQLQIWVSGVLRLNCSLAPSGVASSLGVGITMAGAAVQSVALWSRALSSDELVAANTSEGLPVDQLKALLALDQGTHPMELANGVAPTSSEDADFSGRRIDTADLPPAPTPSPSPAPVAKGPPPELKQAPAAFSAEREAALREALERYLATLSGAERDALRAREEARIQQLFTDGRGGRASSAGTILAKVRGSTLELWQVGPAATSLVHTMPAPEFAVSTECGTWIISVACTALFGLLGILGIALPVSKVTSAVVKVLTKSKVLAAIAEVLVGTFEAKTILAMVEAIYNEGMIWSFVKAALSSLSWWDLAWMVGDLVSELLLLIIPEAAPAVIMYRLGVLVTQMALLLNDRPAGCCGS